MTSNNNPIKLNESNNGLINTANELISEEKMNTTINNLPVELLSLIFKYLDVLDLPNCRLVSKLWKFNIDRIKITELILLDCSWDYKWAFENESINKRNRIRTTISSLYKCSFELSNVRRLRLGILICKEDFEIFKLFPMVHHLEIFLLQSKGKEEVFTLDLPELKKLFVYAMDCSRLIVNSKIEALSSLTIGKIVCTYPLDVKMIQMFELFFWDVSIYKNVECLILMRIECLLSNRISDEITENQLQNLKIIKCYSSFIEPLPGWQSGLDQLIQLRLKLKKENSWKIYFNNIEIIGARRLKEYGFK